MTTFDFRIKFYLPRTQRIALPKEGTVITFPEGEKLTKLHISPIGDVEDRQRLLVTGHDISSKEHAEAKRSSLACPQYHHHHRDQAHSRLTSAIPAPQTPRWRPPATGDYASQPLTGTRRAALLGRSLKKSKTTQ